MKKQLTDYIEREEISPRQDNNHTYTYHTMTYQYLQNPRPCPPCDPPPDPWPSPEIE